jgi:hypothetical protein
LIINLEYFYDVQGFASGNANIALSTNTNLSVTNNVLNGSAKDGTGNKWLTPKEIDPTRDIQVFVIWAPSTADAGNVELNLTLSSMVAGTILDGTRPEETRTQIVSLNNQENEIQVTEFLFDASLFAVDGSIVYSTVWRDASAGNPNDTYSGDVEIAHTAVAIPVV